MVTASKGKTLSGASATETQPRGGVPHNYVWANGAWRNAVGQVRDEVVAAEDRRNRSEVTTEMCLEFNKTTCTKPRRRSPHS